MFTKLSRHDETGTTAVPVALSRPLTRRALRGRRVLKRFLYSQLAMRQAIMIALGKEQPIVNFTVEADPPSVYFVYRLRPEVVPELGDILGLPPEFASAPLRCLATDDPAHLLVLNVYRVSGLAKGLRAEWSVFVGDAEGVPRYMVFDARSSLPSMDPIDVITRRSTVEHERTGSTITIRVGDGDVAFTSTIEIPPGDAAPLVPTAPEWSTANDYIYWGNGICDRTYYDAGMAAARVRSVPPASATINDGTPWADLVEPGPVHVLVFEDAIELAITPWENLSRLDPPR